MRGKSFFNGKDTTFSFTNDKVRNPKKQQRAEIIPARHYIKPPVKPKLRCAA